MIAGRLLGRAIDRVRIHRVWSDGGRIYKHRRFGMGLVIACGNVFLRLSRSRILMFPVTRHWQVFELHAFHLANGDAFASGAHGRRAIWMERMPGTSLREHLGAGTLDERMLAAAGAEIGRVHRLHSDAFAGPWSHGDLHLENALYDPAEGRVRLIDFETVHEDGLDPIDRHADDLLVPILDLIGACDGDVLGRRVRALLEGYDNPAMASPLRRRLVMPSGLESVLWHTRTSFIAEAALAARIEVARDAVGAS